MTSIADLLPKKLIWTEKHKPYSVRVDPEIWQKLRDNPREVLAEVFNAGVAAGVCRTNASWLKEANRPGGAVRWAHLDEERVVMVRVMYQLESEEKLYSSNHPIPKDKRHFVRTWYVVRNGEKGEPYQSRNLARIAARGMKEIKAA